VKDELVKAADDFRYLLSRDYPRAGALNFTGNRYQLDKAEREILNRGVYPEAVSRVRREKLIDPDGIAGRPLGVDGHNVLITLESALLERTLVEADDGLIRDTAGIFASYRPRDVTDRALTMILEFIESLKPASVLFLLDAPLSRSGDLAGRVGAALAGRDLTGQARAVPVPERELYNFPGPVASSDSVLIDRVAEPFDLAGCLIRRRWPDLHILKLN